MRERIRTHVLHSSALTHSVVLLAYIIVQMDDDVVASNRDLYRYFRDDDERPLCVG